MDWLNELIKQGVSVYNTNQTASGIRAQANAQAAAANAATAQAAEQNRTWLKIALIGGGVLLAVGLVIALVKGK